MVSERLKRQIDRLLDEAEEAAAQRNWEVVRDRAQYVLTFDPANPDGLAFFAAAERALKTPGASPAVQPDSPPAPIPAPTAPPQPISFANGRYQVEKFLGEGGKKRVYLAHDSVLDRDVALAVIKPALSPAEGTEGLDAASISRVTREAQALSRLGDHPHILQIFDLGRESFQG
jgi:hypothetical protein